MPRRSPVQSAQPNSVSICGKLLQPGQSITVPESAIGPRERKAESRGKIRVRSSNKPGHVQVVCTLKR
jgi:hypothetical protein